MNTFSHNHGSISPSVSEDVTGVGRNLPRQAYLPLLPTGSVLNTCQYKRICICSTITHNHLIGKNKQVYSMVRVPGQKCTDMEVQCAPVRRGHRVLCSMGSPSQACDRFRKGRGIMSRSTGPPIPWHKSLCSTVNAVKVHVCVIIQACNNLNFSIGRMIGKGYQNIMGMQRSMSTGEAP